MQVLSVLCTLRWMWGLYLVMKKCNVFHVPFLNGNVILLHLKRVLFFINILHSFGLFLCILNKWQVNTFKQILIYSRKLFCYKLKLDIFFFEMRHPFFSVLTNSCKVFITDSWRTPLCSKIQSNFKTRFMRALVV